MVASRAMLTDPLASEKLNQEKVVQPVGRPAKERASCFGKVSRKGSAATDLAKASSTDGEQPESAGS